MGVNPYGQGYAPAPQKHGNSNTVLVAIIAVLATLLLAGLIYFLLGRSDEPAAKPEPAQPTVVHDTIVKERTTIVEKPTVVKQVRPANPTSIVVNGTNVCLRLQPYIPSGDRYSNTLKYTNGTNVHPAKGTVLPYVGETGQFYQTVYNGYTVYIAKQFSILQ